MTERTTSWNLRYLAPSAVTAASMAAGFFAVIAAARGSFELSVYLLALAITLDSFDGPVARLLHATSKFGQEMDSISDAVSFATAPALLIYLACLHELGVAGMVISFVYLLAGTVRLARFNLISDVHEKGRRIVGVPTPVGAAYLMATVLMREQITAAVAAAVTVVMAVLMVTRIPLPTIKGWNRLTAMLVVVIFSFLAVIVLPSWYTIGWWTFWNAVTLWATRLQDQRLESPPASA